MNLPQNQSANLMTEEPLSEAKISDIKLALRKETEVQNLARSIDERDQIKILEFGKEPAVQISRFSDQILGNMRTTKVEDSGELLKQLTKIMDKFDPKDFQKIILSHSKQMQHKSQSPGIKTFVLDHYSS